MRDWCHRPQVHCDPAHFHPITHAPTVNLLHDGCAALVNSHQLLRSALSTVSAGEHVYAGSENQYWILRSATDTIVTDAAYGGEEEEDHYLYWWDDRDGPGWMGWWITPVEVGNSRYLAAAYSSASSPTDQSLGWERAGDRLSMVVVRNPRSGAGDMELIVSASSQFEEHEECLAEEARGIYGLDRGNAHSHGGRPVWKRLRGLTREDINNAQCVAISDAQKMGCCTIS